MRLTISFLLLAVAPGSAIFAANEELALPLFFIPNSGQADPALRYLVQTPELRAGFAVDSAVFQVNETQIRVRFAGSNPRVAMEGLHAMAARANFLIGDDPAGWHTGLPTYAGIVYRNLYPGIDMNYTGSDPKLKSEFRVASCVIHIDPRIQIAVDNAGIRGESGVPAGRIVANEEVGTRSHRV